jgi:hypothetical protein
MYFFKITLLLYLISCQDELHCKRVRHHRKNRSATAVVVLAGIATGIVVASIATAAVGSYITIKVLQEDGHC